MAKASPVLAILFLPGVANAWGPTGHRIVGRVAEHHLTEAARSGVTALLGSTSLARASTWADEVRSDPEWRQASPWHYVTIEDNETYETSDKNPAGDVIEAMRRFEAILRDSTAEPEARRQAVRWLVHLVGDVHQPLHVGRGDDRGGNNILVLWFGEPSNLHKVWDSDMVASTQLSFSEFAEFIDPPSEEEIATWQDSTYLDWVRESQSYRKRVYEIGQDTLGYEYSFKNLPLVEHRLLQAGVRLAGALNSIFASED